MTINLPSSSSATSGVSDDQIYVKLNPKKYPQRSTIQHWQLRDLLHCPLSRYEFYYVHQNNVYMYNTRLEQASACMKDLTFSPTSMATGYGYLAAGGQRNQLMVRQLNSSWFAQTSVGGSINNAICIASHPRTTDTQNAGETRLLVCNNDESIKIFSLPSLQRVTTLGLPTAVNYASVSPDGQKLCAVGDSNQVFLYDCKPNGFYERIATLTSTNDAGFSCAWNHSSERFAVATQDGFVSVWDIRYIRTGNNALSAPSSPSRGFPGSFSSARSFPTSPAAYSGIPSNLNRDSTKLSVIPSTQNPLVKGAIRSVKFCPSPSIDVLAFSEHLSYVNFVDARTFDPASRQSVRVGSAGTDTNISGISFSPDSRSCFVGLETSVLEFEVDTIARRSFPKGTLI